MTALEEDPKKWAREYDIDWHDPQSRSQARLTVAHIRDLDPETIAKEAAPPARKDHRADAAADAFYVEEADQ